MFLYYHHILLLTQMIYNPAIIPLTCGIYAPVVIAIPAAFHLLLQMVSTE